jgi:GT2 family glycosyltransferase
MGRDVSIVLITFNSAEFLPRCLEGIAAQLDAVVRLIVIDNASTDGSLDHITAHFPEAVVVRNETNRGFAAAANQGIALAESPFVLLLNPDVFMEPRYVANVVAAMSAVGESVGSAAGKLLRGEGAQIAPTSRIDSLGIRMTRSGRHLDDHQGEANRDEASPPFAVFGVTGAAAIYRKAFLDDVAIDGQPFDERFFAYREDADLSWRGQLMGWKSLVVPDAVAYHVRRVTPERRSSLPAFINMHSVKNRFLLRFNNEGMYLALRNAPFEWLRDLVVVAGVVLKERSSFPALTWLWRNRADVMRRRRTIQQRRRVSDRQLAHWFR